MPRRRGQFRRRRNFPAIVGQALALVRVAKRTGRPEDIQRAMAYIQSRPRLARHPELRAFLEGRSGAQAYVKRRPALAAYRRGRFRYLNQPGGGWSPQTPTVIPHQFEPATGYPQTWTSEGGVVPDPLVYEDEPTHGAGLASEDAATDTPYMGRIPLFRQAEAVQGGRINILKRRISRLKGLRKRALAKNKMGQVSALGRQIKRLHVRLRRLEGAESGSVDGYGAPFGMDFSTINAKTVARTFGWVAIGAWLASEAYPKAKPFRGAKRKKQIRNLYVAGLASLLASVTVFR